MFKAQTDYSRKDLRGTLTQVNNKFPVKQVNILELNRGSIFGGHYHKQKKELFYVVSGMVVLTICSMKGGPGYRESTSYTFFPGEAFVVEPYDSHTLFAPHGKVVVVELLSKPFSEHDTFCVFEEEK